MLQVRKRGGLADRKPLEIEGFEESFEYNAAGEVIERNAPDGVSYLYEYDYLGLLKKVSKLESTLAEPIIEILYIMRTENARK